MSATFINNNESGNNSICPDTMLTNTTISTTLTPTHSKPKLKINKPGPLKRKDLLKKMIEFKNKSIQVDDIYDQVINAGTTSVAGFNFETLIEILIVAKCFPGIDYDKILYGQIQSFHTLTTVKDILDKNINSGGNPTDITIQLGNTIIPITVKHRFEKQFSIGESDLSRIDADMQKQKYPNYKIGFITSDKKIIQNYKAQNSAGDEAMLLRKVITDGLLFDATDVKHGLAIFIDKFAEIKTVDEFVERIDKDYLQTGRKALIERLHQRMALIKFVMSIQKKFHILAYKMRSGKSIILLNMAKYLLLNKTAKKILIITPVVATIHDFISNIEQFIEFKHISYRTQTDFTQIPDDYNGIVFTSMQYLKAGNKEQKQSAIRSSRFDAIFIDEAHIGSMTDKTQIEILNQYDKLMSASVQHIVFASGTPRKIIDYYKIPRTCVYTWDSIDESHMKQIGVPENYSYMTNTHGSYFEQCFTDVTLDRDYSKCPIQILLKHELSKDLIDTIFQYNIENNSHYGYTCSSLFALKPTEPGKYADEFDICRYNAGFKILRAFLETIISDDPNNHNTIMSIIENTQTEYGSRKSSFANPLLFIVYLPTNTRNGTIAGLQRTLIQFIKSQNLWSEYHIEASNSTEDTGFYSEKYNDFIKSCKNRTIQNKKIGCILLLGKQGNTGITYHDCDVTISLDDCQSLDNYAQSLARALTDAPGKTIGINVDMNVQRTFTFLLDKVHSYKRTMQTHMDKTNAEILQYFYEHKIFLFNPNEFHFGKVKKCVIESYFKETANHMLINVDEDSIIDSIVCDDDILSQSNFRFVNSHGGSTHVDINDDLLGQNPDMPNDGYTKTELDPKTHTGSDDSDCESCGETVENNNNDQNDEYIEKINHTKEICKFLLPLLALLSHIYKIPNFNDVMVDSKCEILILATFNDKNIDLKKITYLSIRNAMSTIIEQNTDIVNCLREIYANASPDKLRALIGKHFIPTDEEKKKHAELPTPVILVDQMLDLVPGVFWENPLHRVFEPCCGKGNFVLAIFDRFYNGLKTQIPNVMERCVHIITKCLYYADITHLNVFITTEILKCHIQNYYKINGYGKNGQSIPAEYEMNAVSFNCNVGNTLEMDVGSIWPGITRFDAVIGNPPYHGETKAKGNSIWPKFVELAITQFIKPHGYLVFVHPAIWRKPGNKLREFMFTRQIHYLSIHNKVEGNKIFGATTRYDYYLLENTEPYKPCQIRFEDKLTYDVVINSDLPMIPNFGWSIFEKVLSKCSRSLDVLKDGYGTTAKHVSQEKKETYIHPLLDSISRTKGKRYRWSTKPHPNQLMKKVMFSNGEVIVPFYDDGELGPGPGAMYVLVNDSDEGNKVIDYLNTDLIIFLIRATKWSNFETCRHLFWYIPDYTLVSNSNITNDVVNNFFELTTEEISMLKK